MSELRAAAWQLVTLLEDWLRDGFRREHAPPAGVGPQAERQRAAMSGQTHASAAGSTGEANSASEAAVTSAEAVAASAKAAATGAEAVAASEAAATGAEAVAGEAAAASAEADSTSEASAEAALESLAREVSACTLCGLHRGRTHAVPGEGAARPLVLVIGEGPGADEDRTGRPFVGRAGQYLDKWLAAIGLDRGRNCYIANVVKCRPPGNRDPLPEETGTCAPYLRRQIALLRPRAILTVGRISSQILTGRADGIGRLRGLRHQLDGLPLIATYHPSAVLRDTSLRAAVWEDLKLLRTVLQEQGIAI